MHQQALQKAASFIESWLQSRYDRLDIPGFVVGIAHEGKMVFRRAYGYANLERKEPLTPDHIFRIASQSKMFTATAVLQLQEQGKLRLDDCVTDYIPWLREHQDKRWQQVTIRQLLSHSAGVIRDGLDLTRGRTSNREAICDFIDLPASVLSFLELFCFVRSPQQIAHTHLDF